MTTPSFNELLEAERSALLEQVRADQRERYGDPEGMLWLALAPAWTDSLAAATGKPSGIGLLDQMVEERLCERSRSRLSPKGRTPGVYQMREQVRGEILTAALDDPDRGLAHVRSTLAAAGSAVLAAGQSGVEVPPPLRRWAELAARANEPEAASEHLRERVEAALAEGAPTEAQCWIDAAHPVVDLAAGHLDVAAALASNRLSLAHRREEADRHAASFLERPDQIAAFRSLLSDGGPVWALHYMGLGGMGKTMLATHLAVRLIPGEGGAAARVDFDYLNPSYPTRAPGLLLSQLAAELRLHDHLGAATRIFASFDDLALNWHERVQAEAPGSAAEHHAATGELRNAAIGLFAEALRYLPQPVVLLLDTCEELEKVERVVGGEARNVAAMLEVLEAIHDRFRSLRVVLFGRRPLPARPYMRVHHIGPFSPEEANRYLVRRGVRRELFDAIIERSATDDSTGEALEVAPFELAFYARWALDDPELTVEQIRCMETDRYVEMRIMGRIRDQRLRDLVPLAARLGRLDRAMVEHALGDEEACSAFGELEAQEWIVRQGNFLAVKPAIAQRLRRYFERGSQPAAVPRLRRAADHLEQRTLTQPLADLDVVAHFDALVRLLGDEPDRLARWWEQVEERIAGEGEYGWALQLTGFLLGADGAIGGLGPGAVHPLEAAVLVTHCGAHLHSFPSGGYPVGLDIWDRVAELTGAERGALWLRAQACMCVAEVMGAGNAPDLAHDLAPRCAGLLRNAVGDEQTAGAVVAAVEALVEVLERFPDSGGLPPELGDQLCHALHEGRRSEAVCAFAATLAARIHARVGNGDEAERLFARARALVASAGPDRQRWLHWRAPHRLEARASLEQLRALFPGRRPPEELLEPPRSTEMIDSIDEDRLEALRLQLLQSFEGSSDGVTAETGRLEQRQADAELWLSWPPGCESHRSVLPLSVATSLALARLGLVRDAIDRLRVVLARTRSSASSLTNGRAAEHALLDIARRMRLRDEGHALTTELEETLNDLACIGPLEALDGPKYAGLRPPPVGASAQGWHDWWRARWRPTPSEREALSAAADEYRHARTAFGTMSLRLDVDEVALLEGQLDCGWPQGTRWALEATAGCVDQALRLCLRVAALRGSLEDDRDRFGNLVGLNGIRQAAEIALDEGELLALRLPDRAIPLLAQAAKWYRDSRDSAGATIAGACTAIWKARLGGDLDLTSLNNDYERLRNRRVPALPAWADLEQALADESPAVLDAMEPEWRPWVVRILLALGCASASRRPGSPVWMQTGSPAWPETIGQVWLRAPSPVWLQSWMKSRYASSVEGRLGLPAELEGYLGPALVGSVAERHLPIGPDAAGPADRRPGQQPVARRMRRRRSASVAGAPVPEQVIRISRIDHPDPARAVRTPIHAVLELLAAGSEIEIEVPESGPHQVSRATRSLAAIDVAHPLIKGLVAGIDVKLLLDPHAAVPSWETIFLRFLEERAGRLGPPRICFTRALTRSHERPTSAWPSSIQVTCVIGSSKDREVTDRAFQSKLRGVWDLTIRQGVRLLEGPGDPLVLYVIGEVVPTAYGMAIRTERSRSQTRPATGGERGEVATAEDIAYALPSVDLCILQGEALQYGSVTRADAEQAAYLRCFGAELTKHGVPVVVVLAPAPQDDQIIQLSEVAQRLIGARTVPSGGLVDAVRDILFAGGDACIYVSQSASAGGQGSSGWR